MPRDSKKHKKHNRDYIQRHRVMIAEALGKECFLCGSDFLLNAHRKDGEPHTRLLNMSNADLREALDSDEYVNICRICHSMVHWMKEVFGMEWENIEAL